MKDFFRDFLEVWQEGLPYLAIVTLVMAALGIVAVGGTLIVLLCIDLVRTF